MTLRAALALGAAAALTTGCVKRAASDDGHTAVVVVARIVTLNPDAPHAEALAFKDGKLLVVGTLAEALEAAGQGALIDELPNAVVVPGLVDAHVHLLGLGRRLSIAWLDQLREPAAAVRVLQRAGHSARQGDWLIGGGWDQNDWPREAFPTRASLDEAFPSTPVYLSRIDGHAAWLNGEALRRADITKATLDPPGGRIVRDARGEPTGVLVDAAMGLALRKLPPLTGEQLQRTLKAALERCVQLGLTSVHDAGIDLASFSVLQGWDALGALPLRVYAMADGTGPEHELFLERGPFSGRMLRMRAVKLVLDGALGSRGALLHQPYADDATQSGLMVLSADEFATRARAFADRGFQVAVHSIGDRANHLALDVLGALPKGRHRIEHAQLLDAADVPRFAREQLIASFQPTHATSDMPWAAARVGEERLKFAYAWRSVLDTGARYAFGSDFPIEDANPLLGLYAARTRQDAHGQPEGGWHPEQKVTGFEALAGFTSGAAYAEFAEERRGQLATGFDADFTALSVDPVDGPAAELLNAKVLVTVVDGKDVFRAAGR